MLSKLSNETKTNECNFCTRFVLSYPRWRESTANITISVEKMELILSFHRFFPHFGEARGREPSWYIKSCWVSGGGVFKNFGRRRTSSGVSSWYSCESAVHSSIAIEKKTSFYQKISKILHFFLDSITKENTTEKMMVEYYTSCYWKRNPPIRRIQSCRSKVETESADTGVIVVWK